MSAAQPSAPAATAASARGPPKKRPRHFWEGPDHADDGDEEKQTAAHVAPVTRLYRHALESVFGFLMLAELSRVLSVSRLWSSAVQSLRSIAATVLDPRDRSGLIAASPLARHVNQLGAPEDEDGYSTRPLLTSNDLSIFSRHLASLTSLSCTVDLAQAPRVCLGSGLRSLSLDLKGDESHTPIINDAIVIISRLPNLTDLTLELPDFFATMSFAPLAAAAQLQNFTVGHLWIAMPTSDHLNSLRMLPRLRKMAVPGLIHDGVAYVLRTPHSLQWQEMHEVELNDATAAALSTLPTLTKLESHDCRSLAFLPSLRRLRTLALQVFTVCTAADIVAGLSCCPELTELTLRADDVTSDHLRQAFSQLPLLRTLKVRNCASLESLSFLSDCTHLAQSLHSVELIHCRLHSTELKHVLTLKSLTALTIYRSFVDPLDAITLQSLHPPSVVLSSLVQFSAE